MAGEVRTLADGNLKIALLTTKPANPAAITLTELMAGQEAAEHLAKSTTRFSPTASADLKPIPGISRASRYGLARTRAIASSP